MDVAIERCTEILKALALFTNTFGLISRKKVAPDRGTTFCVWPSVLVFYAKAIPSRRDAMPCATRVIRGGARL